MGNLGLIDRERVLLLPFLLVPLAVPISPKGTPPQYPWEISGRKKRRSRKRSLGDVELTRALSSKGVHLRRRRLHGPSSHAWNMRTSHSRYSQSLLTRQMTPP